MPTSKWGEQAGLQVVGEKDNGIVVSGFKVLATGAILADEILFGTLENGGNVTIDAADDKLTFSYLPREA